MICMPNWVFIVAVGILPAYLMFDRIWATFDNWLKHRTLNPPKNPIGFRPGGGN